MKSSSPIYIKLLHPCSTLRTMNQPAAGLHSIPKALIFWLLNQSILFFIYIFIYFLYYYILLFALLVIQQCLYLHSAFFCDQLKKSHLQEHSYYCYIMQHRHKKNKKRKCNPSLAAAINSHPTAYCPSIYLTVIDAARGPPGAGSRPAYLIHHGAAIHLSLLLQVAETSH